MKRLVAIYGAALFLTGAVALFGQVNPPPRDRDQPRVDTRKDPSVTYGRIKEMTAGQKVVIDVDDAIDKTFELNDKDLRVNLGKELKVGDPVKVTETKNTVGKTTAVTIAKHTGGGVKHGDEPASTRKP